MLGSQKVWACITEQYDGTTFPWCKLLSLSLLRTNVVYPTVLRHGSWKYPQIDPEFRDKNSCFFLFCVENKIDFCLTASHSGNPP